MEVEIFQCLYCKHEWAEKPESFAEKCERLGRELASIGNALMFPWLKPLEQKKKRTCPKCGSTVVVSAGRKQI